MRAIGVPALFLMLLCAASQAGSEEPSTPATDAAPSPVALDALLRLPSQAPAIAADPAPALTRKDWEARFAAAREDLASARAALAASQAELEELASGNAAWQMAPPGASANAENSPVSYKLRQDIRRQREDVERAERALTELRIEANLAGVPEAWQD